jgi:D-xylose transport system ATP-binding protein
MEQEARELLARLSVSIPDVRIPVASLSGGQRQSIAVARSTMGSPKLVLLDEPTAALGVAQTRQVLDLIRRLREQGLGVLVISHNLVDVFAVADRIVVLRLGRRVATLSKEEATAETVVAAITGADRAEVHEAYEAAAS